MIFFIFGKPHPLSACFFFVAGEGERARKCREAVRQSVQCREIQEVENPMGVEKRGKKEKHARNGINGTDIGTYGKVMKSIQFNMATPKIFIIRFIISHPQMLGSFLALPS